MRHGRLVFLIVGVFLAAQSLARPAWADPIKTTSALTTGFAAQSIRVGVESAGSSGVMTSGSPLTSNVLGGGSGLLFTFAIPVSISWPINETTVMTGTIPHLTTDLENTTTHQAVRSSDWGDLTLLIKHAVWIHDTPARLARVALTGGLRLPTGPDAQVNADKQRLPPRLQQGLGSFGAIIGLSWSCVALAGRSETHAALTYKTDAEANDFRAGDLYALDLAVGWRFARGDTAYEHTGQATALLELTARHQKWDIVNGLKLPGTHHNAVFVTPGIQAIVTPQTLIEAAYQLPVIRDYEGNQVLPDYTASLGVRVRY